jgi:phosphonate transport system substrate-binding protein
MDVLKFTSIQAPNADAVCALIAGYVGDCLNLPTVFVKDMPWPEREQQLDRGEIQIGWICGLPYVWKVGRPDPPIELLAAPVMQPPRYQNQPVYFSDVVVRRDSSYQTFADLRGATWAYNEPHSQSGYNITRFYLAGLGETSGFFGRVIASGAHQTSLQMILKGQIDASAIDSTVLETEFQRYPAIAKQIRIIETLGPSPIPPWVIRKALPADLRANIRQVFLQMHRDPRGQSILAQGNMARFARVDDQFYDPIRAMEKLARQVQW